MSEKNDVFTNTDHYATFARERSALYAFLNLHFMLLPTPSIITQMRQRILENPFTEVASDSENHTDLTQGWNLMMEYLRTTQTTPVEELAQILGIDRTRLYRGVSGNFGPPPPYEAVWVDADHETEEVLGDLVSTYHAAGFEPGGESNERVDYIGVELDFLRQLALDEAEAWQKRNVQAALDIIKQEKEFVKRVNTWFSRFSAKAKTFAQTDLYRGHLYLVNGFLADELDRLQEQNSAMPAQTNS